MLLLGERAKIQRVGVCPTLWIFNFILIQTYTVENIIYALGVVNWIKNVVNFLWC